MSIGFTTDDAGRGTARLDNISHCNLATSGGFSWLALRDSAGNAVNLFMPHHLAQRLALAWHATAGVHQVAADDTESAKVPASDAGTGRDRVKAEA